MTLIGPRPPLPSEVAQYNEFQKIRLIVTPGLTCLWQVSKRNEISFEQWVEMDIDYILHRSVDGYIDRFPHRVRNAVRRGQIKSNTGTLIRKAERSALPNFYIY